MTAPSTYEVFPKGRHLFSRRGRELAVNCTPQRITFNKPVEALFQGHLYAMLMWDRQAGKVAVKPCADAAMHLILYRRSQCSVACKAFISATGMNGLYTPTWNEAEQMIEWSLARGDK